MRYLREKNLLARQALRRRLHMAAEIRQRPDLLVIYTPMWPIQPMSRKRLLRPQSMDFDRAARIYR